MNYHIMFFGKKMVVYGVSVMERKNGSKFKKPAVVRLWTYFADFNEINYY